MPTTNDWARPPNRPKTWKVHYVHGRRGVGLRGDYHTTSFHPTWQEAIERADFWSKYPDLVAKPRVTKVAG